MHQKIILFDGVCNLCNSSIQFVIERDDREIFAFASLQSEYGQELLQQFGLATQNFDSIVLVDAANNTFFEQSDAALRIAKELRAPWRWLRVFLALPKALRDWCYKLIARNRYRWFGKTEQCWLPTPSLKKRFL